MMENDGVVIHSQLANSVCVSSSCMGRQWMFRTRMAWIVLCLLLGWANQVQALQTATETDTEGDVIEKEIPEIESYHAVLFPSFTLTLGVFTFWILSRYAQALPYTGVLFLMGTIMGIGAEALNNSNQMNDTITQWVGINSEVLLLVFLPGLIYKDSFTLDVHLFTMALLQCFIFAFPMVLAGTTLTALVAYYIFPYNWSFNLAMTFGSILSATDPVSVAALLEEVGAPPRLRIHINGEALLNDGSAMVFFSIFAQRYFEEMNIEGFGSDVGVAQGVALFFQKSLGAVAVGLFFSLGLLFILYIFKRRLYREERVVEVSATIAIAYLSYYVADAVWSTSGVISTLTLGVTVRFFGRAMINDPKLLDDFWTLVEHILNTVLFTLGGVVWGATIMRGEKERSFTAKDWGYMILIYVFETLIRAFLFSALFPVTSRIGLKTNWPETIFQIHGGLRGAVGIALAIFLDNEVRESTKEDIDKYDEYREQVRKVVALVGGVAFLTLTINGPTAGPFLRKLGLTDETEAREKIVHAFKTRFKANAIDDLVHLLTQARFKNVNFALVRHHVPYLADLTQEQLLEAVVKNKETTQPDDYHPPFLKNILPYLPGNEPALRELLSPMVAKRKRIRRRTVSSIRALMARGADPLSLKELRLLFISVLSAAYESQIRDGELEERNFLAIALQSSLDFAKVAVGKGEPLCDWSYVNMTDASIVVVVKAFQAKFLFGRFAKLLFSNFEETNAKDDVHRLIIERSLAVMSAHQFAQDYITREMANADGEISETTKVVLSESRAQYNKAEDVLQEFSVEEVQRVVSHKFCLILLNKGVNFTMKLAENGLLKDTEAEHILEDIETEIRHVLSCKAAVHPGELPIDAEDNKLVEEVGEDS